MKKYGCRVRGVTEAGTVSVAVRGLVVSSTVEGKKLFLWSVLPVLIALSLLPDGSFFNSSCPGWEGLAMISAARVRVLEACRFLWDGRLQPITFSAERMTALLHVPALDSGSTVPEGDGAGEDGLGDGSVEVHHH